MLSLGVGIATGTKIGLLFGICLLVAAVELCRRHRAALTRYHAPAVLLLVLAVTGAFGTAVGYEQAHREANRIDYSVEPCEQQDGGDTQVTTVSEERIDIEFEALSPGAQEIFLTALQRNGSYSTLQRPPEIRHVSDSPAVTYVRYGSACYALVAGRPIVIPIFIYRYLFTGLFSAALLAVSARSLRAPSFKLPVASLAGVGAGVGTTVALSGLLPTPVHAVLVALPAMAAGWVLAQGVLRLLEARRGERFRDRMEN